MFNYSEDKWRISNLPELFNKDSPGTTKDLLRKSLKNQSFRDRVYNKNDKGRVPNETNGSIKTNNGWTFMWRNHSS